MKWQARYATGIQNAHKGVPIPGSLLLFKSIFLSPRYFSMCLLLVSEVSKA